MSKSIKNLLLAVAVCIATTTAFAYNNGVSVSGISVSDTTSVGQKFILPDCDSQVTMCTVTFPKGASTGWHYHKNLVFAFVEKGTLRVETEDGYTDFSAGDNVFEMQNKIHNGRNVGKGKVVLKVVYVGCKGVDNSIMVDKPQTQKTHKCIGSAGYVWSNILQECVRPWETGAEVFVPKKDGDTYTKAYHIVFSDDKKEAELIGITMLRPIGDGLWSNEDESIKVKKTTDGYTISE